MTRPWVKLDAQTHRKLDALLGSDAERLAYYAAIEEAKLAESEGEWADDREFTLALGRRLARHLPALLATGLLDRTPEGWIRVAGWDQITKVDPTSADRQKRWRDRQRALRNALRDAANAVRTEATVTDGQRRKREEKDAPAAAPEGPAAGAPRANGAHPNPTEKSFRELVPIEEALGRDVEKQR